MRRNDDKLLAFDRYKRQHATPPEFENADLFVKS